MRRAGHAEVFCGAGLIAGRSGEFASNHFPLQSLEDGLSSTAQLLVNEIQRRLQRERRSRLAR